MIHVGHLQNMMRELTDLDMLLTSFLDEREPLQKSDITLRVSDFDDTLFARNEQLENEAGLRENRGEKGNSYILYQLGLPYLINTYYAGKVFPKEIIDQMNPEHDLILTAGIEEIQNAKVGALDLTHFPLMVTKNAQDKVLALIRYVLYTLRFIPQEIIIYEDRPQYFIEYQELIEGVLGCKVTVMLVEMDGNTGYKSIEEIVY